jgi:CheY-like chemotaxis protein
MKILIVDDNEFSIDLLSELLKPFDAEIISAKDGGEAIAEFTASEEGEINLILMDLIMPGMKGNEVAAAIRSMDRADATTVPIYAVTAVGGHNAESLTKEAGINGVIQKPLSFEAISNLIHSLEEK